MMILVFDYHPEESIDLTILRQNMTAAVVAVFPEVDVAAAVAAVAAVCYAAAVALAHVDADFE